MPATFPARVSAAGCARLVLTKAMRAAAGTPVSVGRLPPAGDRQYSADGGPAGGGTRNSLRDAVTGNTGGVAGGGGRPGVVRLLVASPRFVISVRVCSVLPDAEENSQQGSTL